MSDQGFLSQLKTFLSPEQMTQNPNDLQTYGRDWTKVFTPNPLIVVFPRTTEQVVQIVKASISEKIALVPSGGRTGLSAGAVAANRECVVSFNKMNRMDPVNALSRTVRVQAGVITEELHKHCEKQGLTWPVDFSSKGSSHVGGNISTNAGGVRVIHYGMTRNWVLGLQIVTGKGEILELNGALEKNNTGPDLRQLFIGSEGILGLITEATLKLAPPVEDPEIFFFGVDSMSAVMSLFLECRRSPFEILAFETLTHNCLEAVQKNLGVASPLGTKCNSYVLLEIKKPQTTEGKDNLERWLETLFEKNLILDGTLAQNPKEGRAFWLIREATAESIFRIGTPHKNDISVPIQALEDFVAKMMEFFTNHHSDFEIFLFGHIGDGNLHVNTVPKTPMESDRFHELCEKQDQELFTLVKKYEGSISAEHGIGLLKREALLNSKSREELDWIRALKKLMDPHGVLNPGKVIE